MSSLVFKNKGGSSSLHMIQLIELTVKADKTLPFERSLVPKRGTPATKAPSLSAHTALSPVCVLFPVFLDLKVQLWLVNVDCCSVFLGRV